MAKPVTTAPSRGCSRRVIHPGMNPFYYAVIRELKQPGRRRQQKPHKFAYLTMKNSIFTRFARAFVIFWHFEDVLVTWNELFCRCVITLGICVLELNCNQRFRDKKTKLNICHHMLTSTTQLSHRGKNENVCQMFKNEKCTCKACKAIVFLCQICKFVRFLLPSSSWLLKLPIHFGEQIGLRGFSFWVVSLKWGSNWLQIATHTERRLKIQVSSTVVVKLPFWTYITVRERIPPWAPIFNRWFATNL